jgi:DNA-binding NtrC family response regulator
MSKKIVLIVDEDGERAEKLHFIVQLGGYTTRTFNSASAAFNWAEYGCPQGEVLCLLFNHLGQEGMAEKVFATWMATGMIIPVVMVQRGKEDWNQLLNIGEQDHFFICAPESVMQTLDILSVINYTGSSAEAGSEELLSAGI